LEELKTPEQWLRDEKTIFSLDTKKRYNEVVSWMKEYAEDYHRAKVNEIKDEEINIKSSYYDLDVNIALIQAFKDGAKWFKNRLLKH